MLETGPIGRITFGDEIKASDITNTKNDFHSNIFDLAGIGNITYSEIESNSSDKVLGTTSNGTEVTVWSSDILSRYMWVQNGLYVDIFTGQYSNQLGLMTIEQIEEIINNTSIKLSDSKIESMTFTGGPLKSMAIDKTDGFIANVFDGQSQSTYNVCELLIAGKGGPIQLAYRSDLPTWASETYEMGTMSTGELEVHVNIYDTSSDGYHYYWEQPTEYGSLYVEINTLSTELSLEIEDIYKIWTKVSVVARDPKEPKEFEVGPLKSIAIGPNEYDLKILSADAYEEFTMVQMSSSIVPNLEVTYYADEEYAMGTISPDAPVLGTTPSGIVVKCDNDNGICAWEQSGIYVELSARGVSQFDIETVSLLIETIVIVPR